MKTNLHFAVVRNRYLMLLVFVSTYLTAWGLSSTVTIGSTNYPTAQTGTTVSGTGDLASTWDVTVVANYFNGNDNGIHAGSNSKTATSITLTSSSFSGKTITAVSVTGRDANGTESNRAVYTAKVNGSTFGSTSRFTTSSATYTAEGSVACTGNVSVEVVRSSAVTKAIYVSAVSVTFSNGGGGTTYTVTYNLNGGSGTTPTESAKASGATFTLHNGTTSVTPPSGKLFNKWKDQDDNLFDGGATYTMPSKNVTLTAQWVNAYTVTYNANGGTGSTTDSNSPYKSGATVTTITSTFTVPDGKSFSKWNTADDGSGTDYAVGATFTISANTTLYAQWVDATYYELIENANDISAGSYLIVYNNTYALNTHYGNVNANTYGTYTDISSHYSSKKIESNATTDALAYTVTKTTNGYSIKHSETISSVTKDIFLGYNSTGSSTGAKLRWDDSFGTNQNEWTLGVNSVVSVYDNSVAIRWNNNSGSYRFAIYGTTGQQAVQLFKKSDGSNTHSVTYNGNDNTGGSVPTDDDSPYEEDATVTVLGNSGSLVRTGYTFNGWNTEADGSGTHYDEDDTFTMSTSNVVLYAEWKSNAAEKAFNLVEDLSELEAGKNIIIVANYSSSYYAMSVDRGNNRLGVVAAASQFTMSNSNKTLTTASTTTVEMLTLTSTDAGYLGFKTLSEQYLYAGASDNNHLKTKAYDGGTLDNDSKWKITLTDGVFSVAADNSTNRNVMQFNGGNNPVIFSCYASASQTNVLIYVEAPTCDEDPGPGTVTVSGVHVSGASVSCSSVDIGDCKINEWGFVYGTSTSPTGNMTKKGENSTIDVTETFSLDITGLAPGTKYYVRAYAKAGGKTVYGEEKNFTTKAIIEETNNSSYGTVSRVDNVITGSPNSGYTYAEPAYTVFGSSTGSTTTVTKVGNDFTINSNSTSDITVTINFRDIPTDHFIDDVQSTTGYTGAGMTKEGDYSDAIPTIADKTRATSGTCEQLHYHFAGWVTAANKADPSGNIVTLTGQATNTTYYAVWEQEISGGDEEQEVFREEFNACTGTGANGDGASWNTGASSTFASDNTGWTTSRAYAANNCGRFGSGSAGGSAQTPTIACKSAVSAVLTFKAGAWNGGGEGTSLSISATNCSLNKSSVDLTKGAWTTYTVNISSITDDIKITFSTASGNCRFFLDEVVVNATFHTYDDPSADCSTPSCGRPTSPTSSSVTAYTATIGWAGGSPGTLDHYEYAVWADSEAEPTSGFTSNAKNTSAALTGLRSNTLYRWKVRQVCTGEDGNSKWLTGKFTTSAVTLSFSVPDLDGVSDVDGQSSTTVLPTADVPTACDGCWIFAGWTPDASYSGSSKPATFFAGGEYAHVTSAEGTTLYAVYYNAEYTRISSTSGLVANENYVLTFDAGSSTEYALSNTAHASFENDAAVTDLSSKQMEREDGNYLYTIAANNMWKFTGTSSSGQLYNVASGKYLNLTSQSASILNSADNLTFTVSDGKWTISSLYYLGGYGSPSPGGYDAVELASLADRNLTYIYHESATYSTTPYIYTITWLDNGTTYSTGSPTTYTTICDGAITTFPTAPASVPTCTGADVFAGWSEEEMTGTGNAKPEDLFTKSTDVPRITEDKTFHAIYAKYDATKDVTTDLTSTFTSKSWGDADELWTSEADGNSFSSGRGVQITTGSSGANATTKASYYKVTSVVVTYSTNASDGVGSIAVTIGGTSTTASASVSTTGGTSDRTITYSPTLPATELTGVVNITATCTTNSIYIKSVRIYYTARGLKDYISYCSNVFEPSAETGVWNATANWSLGHVPTINERAIINKPVVVDVATAKAKEVILNQSSGNTGSLEIPAGKALTVAQTVKKTTDGSTLSPTAEGDLVFGSTLAAGTGALVMNGYTSGDNKATVNFAVKAKNDNDGWVNQFIGTPFNDQGAVLYNYYGTQLYAFHPAKDGSYDSGTGSAYDAWWSRLAETDGMDPFMGYNILCSKAESPILWMQGTLNASSNVTFSSLAGGAGVENLLANSWMAPIHIGSFQDGDFTNVEKTIYIFNAGTPDDYNPNDSGAEDAEEPGTYIVLPINSASWTDPTITVIPAMQAFSVFATGTSPSLTLNYNQLVYTPALTSVGVVPTRAPRRAGAETENAPEVIRLRVAAESGYAAKAYILGREDFNEGFDDGWDGRFMEGDYPAPQLYAPTENGNMVINCVPEIEGTVLCFKPGTVDSEYTFTFSYEGEESWYLNDQKEQESTLISALDSYTFHSSADDMPARFVVSRTPIYKTPTGVEGNSQKSKVESRKMLIDGVLYIIRNGLMYDVTGALCK